MSDLSNTQPDSRAAPVLDAPDRMVKVRDVFGIDSDMEVPAFSEADERVPDLDPAYARGFRRAMARGVEAYAVKCAVTSKQIQPVASIAMDEPGAADL